MVTINDTPPVTTPVAADTPGTTGTAPSHVVLPGETLPSIARDYGVALPDLQAANPEILNPDVIYPGDTLALPPGATPPPQPDEARPQDILRALEEMPRPSLDDIPYVFEEATRADLHKAQLADYHERRIALASEALATPQRSDFDGLPAAQQGSAYERALADLEAAKPALENILRETQLERLEGNATFQALSLDAQSLVRHALSQLDPVSADFQTLLLIGQSPGLQQLSDEEQLKFMLLMNADGRQLGFEGFEVPVDGATLTLENTVVDTFAFRAGIDTDGQPVDDVDAFRDFLDNNPTGLDEPFPTQPTVPYGISDPVKTNEITLTETGNLPLLTYYVDVNGETVTVKIPENPPADLNLPTIEQVAQALAALPPESRGLVTDIEVHALSKFGKPDTYMDIADGHVNMYPGDAPATTEALLGGLVHETAHAVDGENRLGTFESLRWFMAMRSDRIDASDYARESLTEDFAETYKLYMSVRGTPDETEARSLMPERFALIDEILAS